MPVLRNENERNVHYLASYLNKNRFFSVKNPLGAEFYTKSPLFKSGFSVKLCPQWTLSDNGSWQFKEAGSLLISSTDKMKMMRTTTDKKTANDRNS